MYARFALHSVISKINNYETPRFRNVSITNICRVRVVVLKPAIYMFSLTSKTYLCSTNLTELSHLV